MTGDAARLRIIDRPVARIEGISARRMVRPASAKDTLGLRRSSPDEEIRRALNGCEVVFEMGEVLHV
jgi:hypothetical protein